MTDRPAPAETPDLLALARENLDVMTVSTIIMAQDIRKLVPDDAGIDRVIEWCNETGVTRMFLETYRGRVTADRDQLTRAADRMRAAGLTVDGCVTTTRLGPVIDPDDRYMVCFTRAETLDQCQRAFEYAASIFDVIMIDDFLFTTCQCELCRAARGDRTWSEYRTDVMVQCSRDRILAAARAVNPDVHIIIKFPNWFDMFQVRGYDVPRQTAMFDSIWVGAETREPTNVRWGRLQQYRGFFIMRWLAGVGGAKTGGGWFDGIDTGPVAYVEQARQTVLGGAREMLLFNCGSLLKPANVEQVAIFRRELPELFRLSRLLKGLPAKGVIAVKPPNSDPGDEDGIYDYPGILGLPIVPAAEIPEVADAVFLPTQALGDPDCIEKIKRLIAAQTPILMTDGLASRLEGEVDLDAECIEILEANGEPYSLREIPTDRLARIREHMLTPLGVALDAPRLISLYLLGHEYVAIESFRDEPAEIKLRIEGMNDATVELAMPEDQSVEAKRASESVTLALPARTLALLRVTCR